jgi:hypothetical protein
VYILEPGGIEMKDGRFFKFSAGLLSALALIALFAVPACNKGKSGTKTGQSGAVGKVEQTVIARVGNNPRAASEAS